MFYEAFIDELDKLALDEQSAVKMTDALKSSGKLIRRPIDAVAGSTHPRQSTIGPSALPAPPSAGVMRAANPSASAAKVNRVHQKFSGLTRGQGRVFANKSLSSMSNKTGVPLPQAPAHKQMINRMVLGHEGSELRHGAKRKTVNPTPFNVTSGHISPGVLAEESSMVSSLSKKNKPVKDYFTAFRKKDPGVQNMERLVRGPEGKPGFQYGQRYSRHARKRIAQIVDRKLGVEAAAKKAEKDALLKKLKRFKLTKAKSALTRPKGIKKLFRRV